MRHPDGSYTGDLTPWTDEQEAAAEPIEELRDRLEELQKADIKSYGDAFADAVRAAVVDLFPSLRVPVEVTVHLQWTDAGPSALEDLMWAVFEKARSETPTPSSGIALKDYPPGADIADVERAENRTPLQRIDDAPAADTGA